MGCDAHILLHERLLHVLLQLLLLHEAMVHVSRCCKWGMLLHESFYMCCCS